MLQYYSSHFKQDFYHLSTNQRLLRVTEKAEGLEHTAWEKLKKLSPFSLGEAQGQLADI